MLCCIRYGALGCGGLWIAKCPADTVGGRDNPRAEQTASGQGRDAVPARKTSKGMKAVHTAKDFLKKKLGVGNKKKKVSFSQVADVVIPETAESAAMLEEGPGSAAADAKRLGFFYQTPRSGNLDYIDSGRGDYAELERQDLDKQEELSPLHAYMGRSSVLSVDSILTSDYKELFNGLLEAGMNEKEANSAALNILTLNPANFSIKDVAKKTVDELRERYCYDFDERKLKIMGYKDARGMMLEYDKMAKQATVGDGLFHVAHRHASDSKAVIKDANKAYYKDRWAAGEAKRTGDAIEPEAGNVPSIKRSFAGRAQYALTGSLPQSALVPDNSDKNLSRWKRHYKFDLKAAFQNKFFKKVLKYPSKFIYKFKPYTNVPMEVSLPNAVRLKDGDFAGKMLPAFNVKIGSVERGEIDTILAASPAYHLSRPNARIDYAAAAAPLATDTILKVFKDKTVERDNKMTLPRLAQQLKKFFEKPLSEEDDLKDLALYLASKQGILPQNHITDSEILDIAQAMCLEYEEIQRNTEKPPEIGLQKGLKRYIFEEFAKYGGVMPSGKMPEAMRSKIQETINAIRENRKAPSRNLRDSLVAYVKEELGKEIYSKDFSTAFVNSASQLEALLVGAQKKMRQTVAGSPKNPEYHKEAIAGIALNDLLLRRFRHRYSRRFGGDWYSTALEHYKQKPEIIEALRTAYIDIASLAAEERYKKAQRVVGLRDDILHDILGPGEGRGRRKEDGITVAAEQFFNAGAGDKKDFVASTLRIWGAMQTGWEVDLSTPGDNIIYQGIRKFLLQSVGQSDFLEQMQYFYSPAESLAALKEFKDQCLEWMKTSGFSNEAQKQLFLEYLRYEKRHEGKKGAGYEKFVTTLSEVWNKMVLGQKVKNSERFAKEAIEAMLQACDMPKDFLRQSGRMMKACPESTLYRLMSERDASLIKAFELPNARDPVNEEKREALINRIWLSSRDMDSMVEMVEKNKQSRSWLGLSRKKQGSSMSYEEEVLTFWEKQLDESVVPEAAHMLPRLWGSFNAGRAPFIFADTESFQSAEESIALKNQTNNHPLEQWARMIYEANAARMHKLQDAKTMAEIKNLNSWFREEEEKAKAWATKHDLSDEELERHKKGLNILMEAKKEELRKRFKEDIFSDRSKAFKSKAFQIDFWIKDYARVLSAQYPIVFFDKTNNELVKLYPAPDNKQKMLVVADHGICLGTDVNKIIKDPQGGVSDAIGVKNFIIESVDSKGIVKKINFDFAFFVNYQDYKRHDFSLEKMKPLVEWAESVLEDSRQLGAKNVSVISNCHAGINRSQAALVLLDAIARKNDMLEEFKRSYPDKGVSDLDKTREFVNAAISKNPSNLLASISHVTEQGNTMQYSQYKNLCTAMRLSMQNDLKRAGLGAAESHKFSAGQTRRRQSHVGREQSRKGTSSRDR